MSARRVLVTEDVEALAEQMRRLLEAEGFVVELARDGEECLEKVRSFGPDLVVLDIMLPKLHGFDVLNQIRADPKSRHVGVIVCTAKTYKPDLDRARELGAADVVQKPIDPEDFVAKVRRTFQHAAGSPPPPPGERPEGREAEERFVPRIDRSRGHARFWGTRGSSPVSGQRYVRHGGNTSCLELTAGGEMIIIDAGTGIRELGDVLAAGEPRRLHILVTHTHWDHIQGFPFFAPAYTPGFEIVIYGASGFGKDLRSIFRGQLDRDYFPVQMEDMKAAIEFRHLDENPFRIGDVQIAWEFTHHPGAAVAFRLDVAGRRIGHLGDNEFLKGYLGPPDRILLGSELLLPYRKLVDFMTGVEVLIGEAQYQNDAYESKIGWGHSSLSNACLFVRLCGARQWIVTHHDPQHGDEYLDNKLSLTRLILRDLGGAVTVRHAFDGMVEWL